MLFDTIRDFYVQHVFGGILSNGQNVTPTIGKVRYVGTSGSDQFTYYTNNWYLSVGDSYNGANYMPIGDWLSTMATIVTLIIIVSLCFFFIWRIFKFVSGAILLK